MSVLIISQAEVRRLLSMSQCIDLMAETLTTLARGEGTNPLRWGMPLPESRGVLGMMPGSLEAPRTMGLKVVSVLPGNHGTGYDSHQGIVLLFEPEHGTPVAIVDASEITAIRTAAVSGLATRLLARDNACDLAIIGSGVQARSHFEAMMVVRKIRSARVYSRNEANRRNFAKHAADQYNIPVEAVSSVREAVAGAHLICTTTSSREPILTGDCIAPGAHINAVGSSIATARELDTAAVVKSRLYVDRRESTLREAGDFIFPKNEGAINDSHIVGELGEVLLGEVQGRRSDEEITLFKSLGLAVEDLAAAHSVYRRALQEGSGVAVDIGELPKTA
jgi:ornithine cyclodeaminase